VQVEVGSSRALVLSMASLRMIVSLLVLILTAVSGLPSKFHGKALSLTKHHPVSSLSSSTSTLPVESQTINTKNDMPPMPKEVVVVGSGPIGLATAIMLARRGVRQIQIFDQLPEPPRPDDKNFWGSFRSERSYNIGLSGRGQRALTLLGVMPRVNKYVAPLYGAVFWTPSTPPDKPSVESITGRRYRTACIERDRLVGSLLEEVRENYSDRISVTFDTKLTKAHWQNQNTDQEQVVLTFQRSNSSDSFQVTTSLVVGADGANSALREAMSKENPDFKYKAYEDNNPYVYRTLPIYFPRENFSSFCPGDMHMSFSIRTKENILLETLPTRENVHLGALLYKADNPLVASIKTADDAKEFFAKYFPMTNGCIDQKGFEKLMSRRESRFPRFQYVYPLLHHSTSAVLLGDSIHSVKPYFGLGVNSAFDDILTLDQCLEKEKNNIPNALKMYSSERAKEAKALVTMSHRLDKGFLTFVLPIILDSIFGKLFPGVFERTIVRLFQDESYSFTQAMRRKFRDRVLQIGILASATVGMVSVVAKLARKILMRNIV
jgi:kynurenine 3-monooxygenase